MLYRYKSRVLLDSIDQKVDRLPFSLNHLSQCQSHSYKPADIPKGYLGINPCHVSAIACGDVPHHARSEAEALNESLRLESLNL